MGTLEDSEKFRTYLFNKRQAMSAGPAGRAQQGSRPGALLKQRSQPVLNCRPRAGSSNANWMSSWRSDSSRTDHSETRFRSGSGGSQSESRSRSGSKGIQLCRPRRHVPVAETPGAFLAQDLDEFRKKKEAPPQAPVFRQKPSLGKIKGGKPMNLRFRSSSDPVRKMNVPERFRNLAEDSSKLGVSWRPLYRPALRPFGSPPSLDSSGTSSVTPNECDDAVSPVNSLEG